MHEVRCLSVCVFNRRMYRIKDDNVIDDSHGRLRGREKVMDSRECVCGYARV